MKYYMIEAESKNPLPEIKNWYNRINPKHINKRDAHKIKEGIFLEVSVNKDTIYPGVMSYPYFLLSADAAKVASAYDPDLWLIGIRLFSRENRINKPYFLPILPVIDCLSVQSEFTRMNIDIKKGVIIETKTEGRALFQLGRIEKRRVIIRLDLLESLLRREALSIRAEELEVIYRER